MNDQVVAGTCMFSLFQGYLKMSEFSLFKMHSIDRNQFFLKYVLMIDILHKFIRFLFCKEIIYFGPTRFISFDLICC